MGDLGFGTVLRHTQVKKAVVMFVCLGADRLDWWWGMWLDGDAKGRVVKFSGLTGEPSPWVVES